MTAPFTAEQIDRMELATAIGDFDTVQAIASEGPCNNITVEHIWCHASCLKSKPGANDSEWTIRDLQERQAKALRTLTQVLLPEARRYL